MRAILMLAGVMSGCLAASTPGVPTAADRDQIASDSKTIETWLHALPQCDTAKATAASSADYVIEGPMRVVHETCSLTGCTRSTRQSSSYHAGHEGVGFRRGIMSSEDAQCCNQCTFTWGIERDGLIVALARHQGSAFDCSLGPIDQLGAARTLRAWGTVAREVNPTLRVEGLCLVRSGARVPQ